MDGSTERQKPLCISDRRDDEFGGLAERAIIRAQIKARFFWFDASQHQRPAAFGARRPEIIDELEISSTPAVGRPPFMRLARVSANW
jgi:hypothetical protein